MRKGKRKSNRSVTFIRNPDKTRSSILETATCLFAEHGFHGTGLSDICKKAKANKRMIYHYFGNKEDLYRAVHRRNWEELGAWFAAELTRKAGTAQPSNHTDLLMEAVRIFHDFTASHQIFVRLLIWDGLEGGRASRSLWKDIRGPLYRQIETLVRAAQTAGVLTADLNPAHLIISFMGAVSFYFSHAHTMVDIFEKDPLDAAAIEERKGQILGLFRKLVIPPSQ